MKIFGYELWWWLVAMDSCRCMFYTILMGVYVILMSDVLKVINLMLSILLNEMLKWIKYIFKVLKA